MGLGQISGEVVEMLGGNLPWTNNTQWEKQQLSNFMQWELWTSSGRVAHSAQMLTQRHCFYHMI